LPTVRTRHPDAYVFGEVIHGDYAGFVRDTGVDSVTQYELWKAIWSALNDRNLFELAWALERHNAMLDSFVPQTFIGNHDVTRIASQLLDERHLAHALVILMTCGGLPSIYAGDEQGFRGVKEHRAGGDGAIRPAFPASWSGAVRLADLPASSRVDRVAATASVDPQGPQSSDGASQRASRDRSIPRGKSAVGCAQFDRRADCVRNPCCRRKAGWRSRGPPKGNNDADYATAARLGDPGEGAGIGEPQLTHSEEISWI
jgi:hypothetical protein